MDEEDEYHEDQNEHPKLSVIDRYQLYGKSSAPDGDSDDQVTEGIVDKFFAESTFWRNLDDPAANGAPGYSASTEHRKQLLKAQRNKNLIKSVTKSMTKLQ